MAHLIETRPKENQTSYSWIIVVASFTIVATGMGLVFSFGVFLKPLQEHFGWSRASLSFASSINWIMLGIFSLVFGYLSDRVGTRKVVFAGGLIYAAGLLLTSQAQELWQLYITFGAMTGVGMGSFYVPLTSLAAKWFDKRRGVAVATVSSGNGLGVLIFSPFSRFLIDTAGLRLTFAILGLIVLGLVLPLALLLRDAPQETGLTAAPDDRVYEPADVAPSTTGVENEVNTSLKTSSFWLLSITHFFCCAAHSGPIFHLVAFATDLAIPKMTAAAIFGVMGISSVIGRMSGGILADKMGSKQSLIVFLTLQAGTVFSFLFARDVRSFYSSGILLGVAFGGAMPLYALIAREYFGPQILGTMYGGVFFISSVGMGLGSYLGGFIYDATGNYIWLYITASIIASLAVFTSSVLRPPGRRLWHQSLVKPALSD